MYTDAMQGLRKLIAAATLVIGLATPVHADPRWDAEPGMVILQAGGMTLDQAVAMVQSKYGARVMRANTVEEGGRAVHYIRLMSADRSRVWTVRVDAASGREF